MLLRGINIEMGSICLAIFANNHSPQTLYILHVFIMLFILIIMVQGKDLQSHFTNAEILDQVWNLICFQVILLEFPLAYSYISMKLTTFYINQFISRKQDDKQSFVNKERCSINYISSHVPICGPGSKYSHSLGHLLSG